MKAFRVGHGFDVHPFSPERKLFLGGAEIPGAIGLLGHSDADVLLHAIIDAILGALSWGDIGQWFPDTVVQYRDISSCVMFQQVWNRAQEAGWVLGNCDSVILAQEPKLQPYMISIRESLRKLFSTSLDQISVKATTTEHLGFVGRKEGMAASAVVGLWRS